MRDLEPMPNEYDVFVSHASVDLSMVEPLVERLTKETELRPFFGPWHLIPGEARMLALEHALQRSKTVAVFFGVKPLDPWQVEERQLALQHAMKRHKRVIPVVLPGGSTETAEGEGFLGLRTWVDLEQPEGFKHLIAGIEGQPPKGGRSKGGRSANRRPLRVLVVSTYRPDEELGRAITESITLLGMVPRMITTSSDIESTPALDEQGDVLLLVVAWRYGAVVEGHARSLVELCYDQARARSLPRIVLLVDEEQPVVVVRDFDEGDERWSQLLRLHAFKTRLRTDEKIIGYTHENLGRRVTYGLLEHRERVTLAIEPLDPHAPKVGDPNEPTVDSGDGAEKSDAPASKPKIPRTRKPGTRKPKPPQGELSRYLDAVERDNAKLEMLGSSRRITVGLRIDDLRVKVRIAPRRDDASRGERPEATPEPELGLHEVFSHAAVRGCRGIVLVGHPGSGKSTHVRRMALWLTRRSAKTLGLPVDTIPISISLQALPTEPETFREAVAAYMRTDARLEPELVEALLDREHLVFLLDGLDEVPDEARRARLAELVEQGMRALPRARMLLTRRPFDRTVAPGPSGWLEVQLPPLDEPGARTLVRRWFRATARDELARATAEARADALVEELRSPELRTTRMFELTRNPLMLTALCVLHGRQDRLPTRRVDLYEQCVQVFLQRWRDAAALPRRFGEREARQVLQPLAHWLHENRRTHAEEASIAGVIEPHLRVTLGPDCDARGVLRTLRDADGLLESRGETYGFLHLGIQQYLCARQLRALAYGDPGVLDRLAERVGDPWWRDVMLLLLSLGEPALFEPLMRSLVARPAFVDHQDWITDCLAEAVEVTPAPFIELLEQPPGDDPGLWRRQIAAWRVLDSLEPERLPGVAASLAAHPSEELRRLAGHDVRTELVTVRTARGAYTLVEIPAGRFTMGAHHRERGYRGGEGPQHEVELARFFMGKHPVTNEEYALYLRACPDAREPEYWGDPRYNQPRQPVVGVSWHDATAYCEWAGLALPTEAQWEYACRAGTRTPYWSGRDIEQAAWHRGNSGQRLHAVGEKDPNPFGLHDVHGNVWEWCRDGFGNYEGHPPAPGDGLRHPPQEGDNRMIRGGSWIDDARAARSAYRLNRHPDNRLSYLGFRAVKLVDPDDA